MALSALLVACGPSTAPSPGPGRLLYASSFEGGAIASYFIDASTGQLTPTVFSPVAAETPYSIAPLSAGSFLFAVNFGSTVGSSLRPPSVLAYQISAASGALTALPESPYSSEGEGPICVASDPQGRFLFVGNYYPPSTVAVYAVTAVTGVLTPVPGSPFSTNPGAAALALDPSGRFVYVGSERGPVSVFHIDPGNGSLTPVPSATAARNARTLAIAPSGKYLYMADGYDGISGFPINQVSGALEPRPVARVRTGGTAFGAFSMAMNSAGTLLFVSAAYPDGSISAFSVDGTSGQLTPAGPPYSTGPNTEPYVVALDPSGSFLYSGNHQSRDFSAYRVDPTNGALTPIPGSPFSFPATGFAFVE